MAMLVAAAKPFHVLPFAYAFKRGDPVWLAQVDVFVQRIQRTGRMLWLAGAMLLLWVLGGLMLVAYQAHERQMQDLRAYNQLLAHLFADHATRNIEAASQAGATPAELLNGGFQPQSAEFDTTLRQTLVNLPFLPFLRGLAVVDAQGLVLTSTDRADRDQVLDLTTLGDALAGRTARPGARRAAGHGRDGGHDHRRAAQRAGPRGGQAGT